MTEGDTEWRRNEVLQDSMISHVVPEGGVPALRLQE